MKIPIRYKFFLTASLIALAVIAVSYWLGSRWLLRDKEAYAFETVREIAENQGRRIGDYIDARFKLLDTTREIVVSATLGAGQKKDLIAAIFSGVKEADEVTIRSGGKTVFAIGRTQRFCPEAPVPAGEKRRAITALHGAGVRYLILSSSYGDGESGCMAAVVSPDMAHAMWGMDGLFRLFLFNGEGRLLMTSVKRDDHDLSGGLWRQMKRRPAEVPAGAFIARDSVGDRFIGAFAAVERFDALVVAALPYGQVMGAVWSLQRNLLIAAALALVLAAILSTVLAARMTRSIAVLERASVAISKGDYDQEIVLHSRDEIEDLAAALTGMSRELHAREQALKDANVKLIQAEKLAAFGQLGAGIAHEIKNPLTGMLGYVQLSRRAAAADAKIGEYLKTVEGEILRCKGIIDDLLKFSRQDRGVKGPVNSGEVLAGAVKLVRHQLMLMGVEIVETCAPGVPQAWGNANQIQQVGINLILNAGQACAALKCDPAARDRKFRVEVSCRGEGGFVVIEVADNGGGIPPGVAARMFEPFFTTKPEGQGTGLGLSVSYGIVKEHQGEITFETKPGEGTVFHVRLPAVQPAASGACA